MDAQASFQTKNELAFSLLRDAIVSGELSPGQWIPVEEWAERLGVSQTPVREALRRLEAQGLVEIHVHRGARVTTRTHQHLLETYHMRAALESLAARLAVERLSDEEFADLLQTVESITEEMDQAERAGDMSLVRSKNRDLHMAIYRAAGMPRLYLLIENLWATYPFDTLSLLPGRPAEAMKEHRKLLEAIRTRDPDTVAEAMGQHMKSAQRILMEVDLTELAQEQLSAEEKRRPMEPDARRNRPRRAVST